MKAHPLGPVDHFVDAPQGRLHALVSGAGRGPVVCLVHGNLSSARFFEPLASHLPASWRVVAPDLRGFGRSAALPVDARRGMRDFADDIAAVLADERIVGSDLPLHLVGWSMGGGAVMRYCIDHPERVASVTLIAPLPPYGFGGTRGGSGQLCFADAAGTGAGTVAPELVARLAASDHSTESRFSPRSMLRDMYLSSSTRLGSATEDLFVAEILASALGEENYPGDYRASTNWPYVAPGEHGVVNAMSPLYCDLSAFSEAAAGAPVLWVHGTDDRIVSDTSLLDTGHLGSRGIVPGWPGPEIFPAQPMIAQTRAVLEKRQESGGIFVEAVFFGCGHGPHLEQPDRFRYVLSQFVSATERQPV